jgi:RNA polymerase sigma factor (TIGR02999 family)
VTLLLDQAAAGEQAAVEALLPLVYSELRALAARMMESERRGHTLQPTALVNEAYAKLVGGASAPAWENRRHFFAIAARAMRQVLADHARLRNAEKRGGKGHRITLDENLTPSGEVTEIDLGALHDALEELGRLNERHARIVELRFLAGLQIEDVALALGVSRRTVELDWRAARAWLKARLAGPKGPGGA